MDDSIIRQLRNGSDRARNVLYRQYRNRLYNYCNQLLGNSADAEDAVHETFLKVFNGIDGLHSLTAFRSWIYTIARNESMQMLRKKRPLSSDQIGDYKDLDDVNQKIETDDIMRIVKLEIDALQPEYREIILLREYHHLSYDEIADVLHTNGGTVKARLFRARKKLIEKLSPYFNER